MSVSSLVFRLVSRRHFSFCYMSGCRYRQKLEIAFVLMVCVSVFLHIQELAIAIRVLVPVALPERLQTNRILTVLSIY